MTTKEIRAELKNKLGYNARQVSVSMKHGSLIMFKIRNSKIKKSEIEDFANNFENIYYDDYSGEILSGGNTFVRVNYTDEAKKEMIAENIEACEKAINQIEDNLLIDIEGTLFMIGNDHIFNGFAIWQKDSDGCGTCISHCNNPAEVAFRIAQ